MELCSGLHHFASNPPTLSGFTYTPAIVSFPLDPPKKVSAGIVTSRSIFLIWEAPTLSASDGNLLEYNVYCDNSERVFDMRTPNDSLSIPNLIPDTSYTCCIKANTTVGISSYACTTISTMEDGIKLCIVTFTLSLFTHTLLQCLGLLLKMCQFIQSVLLRWK